MSEKTSNRELKRAVFVDRDGTINFDPGYLNNPDRVELLPGVATALKRLKDAGFEIIVVTNQSGVARGIIDVAVLPKIHERLDTLLKTASGVTIDHYEFCMLMPEDPNARRKPKPDLIFDAARERGVDISRSYMIGDRGSDIEAGVRAQCAATILVQTGTDDKKLTVEPDFVAESLSDAADWILRN